MLDLKPWRALRSGIPSLAAKQTRWKWHHILGREGKKRGNSWRDHQTCRKNTTGWKVLHFPNFTSCSLINYWSNLSIIRHNFLNMLFFYTKLTQHNILLMSLKGLVIKGSSTLIRPTSNWNMLLVVGLTKTAGNSFVLASTWLVVKQYYLSLIMQCALLNSLYNYFNKLFSQA